MKIVELFEEIKGWKHAGSDIAKMRSDKSKATHSVKLVRLKKDGAESKMHDSSKTFKSEAEAIAFHNQLVKNNPTSKIAHNLYVGDKVRKLDGKIE